MMHAQNETECPRCEAFLKLAHPRIVEWFAAIKTTFSNAHIYCSFRNEFDQNKAFSEGLSRLKFPNSRHNHLEHNLPASLALDLFQLTEQNTALFPYKFYKQIWDLTQTLKYPVRWGGNFKNLGDSNHFEIIL